MKINIVRQSTDKIKITSDAYQVLGNDQCISFYFDVSCEVDASDFGDGEIMLSTRDGYSYIIINFPDYQGWQIHSKWSGSMVGICLTNPKYY